MADGTELRRELPLDRDHVDKSSFLAAIRERFDATAYIVELRSRVCCIARSIHYCLGGRYPPCGGSGFCLRSSNCVGKSLVSCIRLRSGPSSRGRLSSTRDAPKSPFSIAADARALYGRHVSIAQVAIRSFWTRYVRLDNLRASRNPRSYLNLMLAMAGRS